MENALPRKRTNEGGRGRREKKARCRRRRRRRTRERGRDVGRGPGAEGRGVGERSETEERRIARGQDGKREQKTRENYGLPWSRPRRHGAHCLAGYPRGGIGPSLPPVPLALPLSFSSLRSPAPSSTFHFALRPPLSLGHEAGEDEACRYLLSFPRPQRNDRAPPPRHHFMVGCSTARLPPGAPSAQR